MALHYKRAHEHERFNRKRNARNTYIEQGRVGGHEGAVG